VDKITTGHVPDISSREVPPTVARLLTPINSRNHVYPYPVSI